ncbi:hypothetical protein 8014-B2_0063 [Lactobacillus phage ATCC 8014-B2]|uniref:Uncharacterized protein n=1 Tax=Lactobacillus phage ATCC 8014-B2 TaxID=1225795 RepID=K4I4D9_9CAUD|nr:hypothetical protein HOQ89_gp083 [Lactobacillus phage ATCC 8014-B2]AFU63130.1 hypothetical protein 8014-B2_0063 [Lactobacillus phage ATCC 8014-B2]
MMTKTKAKDLEVGQELYDFYIDDNSHVKMSKVYVIKKNKTNFYFSYSKYDRTNSYMRLKTTGTLPKMWRPSFIELHYISDDENFGEEWEKQVKERSQYKKKIEHNINELFFGNYNIEDYKKVSESLDEILK